jgi:hypothetical protein
VQDQDNWKTICSSSLKFPEAGSVLEQSRIKLPFHNSSKLDGNARILLISMQPIAVSQFRINFSPSCIFFLLLDNCFVVSEKPNSAMSKKHHFPVEKIFFKSTWNDYENMITRG